MAGNEETPPPPVSEEGPPHGTDVVVVAGLSGAGKSTAMSALEDLGYYCVENLPPTVVEHAVVSCEERGLRKIALAFGGGVQGFVEEAAEVLSGLSRPSLLPPGAPGSSNPSGADHPRTFRVLFLDAADETVLRRFNETRRPHPLLMNRERHEVIDAIKLERERLAPLRALASYVVDTTGMRVHDLRKRVTSMMSDAPVGSVRMQVRLLSFGFKYGVPTDADLVFDVRFLDNPYFVPELRPLTGEDARVREFVMKDEGAPVLRDRLVDLLAFLLPRYEAEGKSYLTIGIGCTGGQHRSVTMAIILRDALIARGFHTRVVHRDALTAEKANPRVS